MHKRGGGGLGERPCRVQVNSEQVSLESSAEAAERLCVPGVGRGDGVDSGVVGPHSFGWLVYLFSCTTPQKIPVNINITTSMHCPNTSQTWS